MAVTRGSSPVPGSGPAARRVEMFSGPIRARLRPPGSKSLTNRALILAALCRGEGVVRHRLRSDDTDGLVTACETLGTIVRLEGPVLRLDGGDGRFPGGGDVDLGAGGTPARFMIAAAGLARLPVRIDGSPRMRQRPVGEGVAMMAAIGAEIDFLDRSGCLPLVVRPSGAGLRGGLIDVGRTASSQFVSAVMLIAPSTAQGVTLRFVEPPTSPTYLELTLDVLERVGIDLVIERQADGGLRSVRIPSQVIPGFDLEIEPDASSAVYPAVLAASHPGSRIEILGLGRGSRQPDAAAIGALERFGCRVEGLDDRTIVTSDAPPRGVDLDCADFPDAAVGLAALAAVASGPSRLFGLETLRVKECDRVAALAIELRKVGCSVNEEPDSLQITPAPVDARRRGPVVSIGTWDDHRMAMAFAILARSLGPLDIEDPACVGKSHPGFWSELEELVPAGA